MERKHSCSPPPGRQSHFEFPCRDMSPFSPLKTKQAEPALRAGSACLVKKAPQPQAFSARNTRPWLPSPPKTCYTETNKRGDPNWRAYLSVPTAAGRWSGRQTDTPAPPATASTWPGKVMSTCFPPTFSTPRPPGTTRKWPSPAPGFWTGAGIPRCGSAFAVCWTSTPAPPPPCWMPAAERAGTPPPWRGWSPARADGQPEWIFPGPR